MPLNVCLGMPSHWRLAVHNRRPIRPGRRTLNTGTDGPSPGLALHIKEQGHESDTTVEGIQSSHSKVCE